MAVVQRAVFSNTSPHFPININNLTCVFCLSPHHQGRSLTLSKAIQYPRGLGGGVSSINAGPIPGETEFIQISQPIRNPNSSLASVSSGVRSLYSPYPVNSAASTPLPHHSPPRSNTPENGLANSEDSPRTVTPTPQGRMDSAKSGSSQSQNQKQNESLSPKGNQDAEPAATPEPNLNQSGGGSESAEDVPMSAPETPASDSPALQSPPGVKAISIPTGNHLQEEEEEEELTVAQRRERTLRDQQIDQITDLLVGAILSGEQK